MDLLSYRRIWSYRFSTEAAAMMLSDIFDRFVQDAPLSVVARGIMENVLDPQFLDHSSRTSRRSSLPRSSSSPRSFT